jgi:hypothetical protein
LGEYSRPGKMVCDSNHRRCSYRNCVPAHLFGTAGILFASWLPISNVCCVSGHAGVRTLSVLRGCCLWLIKTALSYKKGMYEMTKRKWMFKFLLALIGMFLIFNVSSANDDLKFVEKIGSGGNCGPNGNDWSCETVDSAGNAGWWNSLALDKQGNPHISYLGNGDLKYAHKLKSQNEGWWSVVVDSSARLVGFHTSLALDTQSNPYISYFDWDNGNLKYAEKIGSGGNCGPNGDDWSCETVDSAGYVGMSTSLVLDKQGNPHISYKHWGNGDLKYAHKLKSQNEGWWSVVVDSAGDVGWYTSLALDTQGNPHISYYDTTNGDLKYAEKIGSGGNCGPNGDDWSCETVDSAGDVGDSTSLALDTQGNPHISYWDRTNGDLKYAHKLKSQNEGWWSVVVDSAGDVGWYSSLVLDGTGYPHISYYDWANGDLKYAERIGSGGNCGPNGEWSCETVDSAGDVGGYTSLVLDTQGTPHISYYDWANKDLKYASPLNNLRTLYLPVIMTRP